VLPGNNGLVVAPPGACCASRDDGKDGGSLRSSGSLRCKHVKLQKHDNPFLHFSYKNIPNTLTGIATEGDFILKMVKIPNK